VEVSTDPMETVPAGNQSGDLRRLL